MANDSTTKAKGTHQSESPDLQVSPSNTISNAEQKSFFNMKLFENHPDEALHVDSAGLDKATGIDDEALLNTIENDIYHGVSSKSIEEAPSSKLPNLESSSTETREENKPDIPYTRTSTSTAPDEASEALVTLEKDSENVQFTAFPRLPIEIRLKIWHCTFVKRHVSLDFDQAYRFVMREEGTYEKGVRYIPVALAVNQESRQETLKYYEFIFFEEEIDIWMFPDCDIHHIGPGWVNPSLDTIYFSEPPAVAMKDAYDSWFNHIARCIYMGDFRQLEVRHVGWGVMQGQTEPYYSGYDLERLCEHIMRFRGLRKVVLIGDGVAGPTNDQLETIRRRTAVYLESDKYMFDDCIVPVVKARQHSDLETGEKASD
jgi:hypothetical protein